MGGFGMDGIEKTKFINFYIYFYIYLFLFLFIKLSQLSHKRINNNNKYRYINGLTNGRVFMKTIPKSSHNYPNLK